MTVPVVPFVKVPSLWIVFGPATALSMVAGYVLARVERHVPAHGAGTASEVRPDRPASDAPRRKAA